MTPGEWIALGGFAILLFTTIIGATWRLSSCLGRIEKKIAIVATSLVSQSERITRVETEIDTIMKWKPRMACISNGHIKEGV